MIRRLCGDRVPSSAMMRVPISVEMNEDTDAVPRFRSPGRPELASAMPRC
jgi:hypothetical protein